MAIENPPRLLSYDDYAAIDDGNRYEVYNGVLVMTPAPTRRHQVIKREIMAALRAYELSGAGGQALDAPFDVVLDPTPPMVVYQPDVFYVTQDRMGIITEKNVQGAPDIVVEVLSPSNARQEVVEKHEAYEKFGVKEYWIVPLEFDRIEVLTLGPDGNYGRPQLFMRGDVLRSAILPGFELDVDGVFKVLT